MDLFGALIDKIHEFYIISFDTHHKNFVIKYKNQQVRVSFGKVSNHFKQDCEKLFTELNLDKALVMGYYNGRMKLHFSHQIQKKDRQKFRNSWHANL